MFNFNSAAYFYYGSGTVPPCTEDTLWVVFRSPRYLSAPQFDFLLRQLVKHIKDESPYVGSETNPRDLFGNKREIQFYSSNNRGFIKFNNNALDKEISVIFSDVNSQISNRAPSP